MNQSFVLSLQLFFPFLVSVGHNSKLLQKLLIQILYLIVFLARNSLLRFELAMKERIGLLEFIDGLLKIDVFRFDVVILLLELS